MARGRRASTDEAPAAAAAVEASTTTVGLRRGRSASIASATSDTAPPPPPSPSPSPAKKASQARGRGGSKRAPQDLPVVAEEDEHEQEEGEGDGEAPLFFIDRKESAAGGMVVVAGEDESVHEVTVARKGKGKEKTSKSKSKAKKARHNDDADDDANEEEAMLEKLVFGRMDAAELFGSSGAGGLATRSDDEGEDGEGKEGGLGWAAAEGRTPSLRPAWEDEDDAAVRVDIAGRDRLRKLRRGPEEQEISGAEYQERLRARFQDTNKEALSWAALPDKDEAAGSRRRRRGSTTSSDEEDEEEDDDDDEAMFKGLFQSSAALVGSSQGRRPLQPGVLEVLRCRDANLEEPSQAVVQAVQFHPSQGGLLLTAGFDKTLRLFQADGKRNEKRAGVFFPDLPIQSAAFVDGAGGGDFSEVVVSGRRPFFYWYDSVSGATGKVGRLLGREERSLERFVASPDGRWLAFTGQDGYVLLASARTKQWAGEFKMNGTARALCFSQDGAHLLASGGDAVVYRWDLRSRRCLARFRNEGGTVTSALAHGLGGMTAVGAESGVVNLYDDADVLLQPKAGTGAAPEWDAMPLKALPNLTTAADSLAFNHDGQLLAMASRWKRDALRVVHVASRTVFSNWPTGQTPIRYPSALSFSPNSGMLAVGNDRGRVLLYRLRHYDAQ